MQISNSIEATFEDKSRHQAEEWIGFTDYINLEDQLMVVAAQQVLSNLNGKDFLQNSFFKGITPLCQREILKYCTQISVDSGEFLYSSNQVDDKSTPR